MFYKSQMHTLFQTNNCLYCPIRHIRTDCKTAAGSRWCTKPHQVITRPPYVFKRWVNRSSRKSEQPLLSYKLRITVFLQSTQSMYISQVSVKAHAAPHTANISTLHTHTHTHTHTHVSRWMHWQFKSFQRVHCRKSGILVYRHILKSHTSVDSRKCQ